MTMQVHKALEAAAEVLARVNPYAFKDHLKAPADYAHPNPAAINVAKQVLTAYHAALEGRGESEIAEIRGRHERAEGDLSNVKRERPWAFDYGPSAHADRATLLTRLADREAEIVELKVRVRTAADDALQTIDAMLEDLGFLPNAPMRMKIKQALGVAP